MVDDTFQLLNSQLIENNFSYSFDHRSHQDEKDMSVSPAVSPKSSSTYLTYLIITGINSLFDIEELEEEEEDKSNFISTQFSLKKPSRQPNKTPTPEFESYHFNSYSKNPKITSPIHEVNFSTKKPSSTNNPSHSIQKISQNPIFSSSHKKNPKSTLNISHNSTQKKRNNSRYNQQSKNVSSLNVQPKIQTQPNDDISDTSEETLEQLRKMAEESYLQAQQQKTFSSAFQEFQSRFEAHKSKFCQDLIQIEKKFQAKAAELLGQLKNEMDAMDKHREERIYFKKIVDNFYAQFRSYIGFQFNK